MSKTGNLCGYRPASNKVLAKGLLMATIVLAGTFVSMNSTFLNAAETFEPTFSSDKKTLELFPANTYSDKFWRLNNWRKLQKVEISFPDDKTPDGTPCIQIDIKSTEGGCNVIAPSAFTPPGAWRSEQYDVISFWVKGDCGGKKATIQVDVDSGAYAWAFVLNSDQWRKVTLPVSSAFSRTGNRTDLHSLKLLYFSSQEELSFRIGSIALEKKISNAQ